MATIDLEKKSTELKNLVSQFDTPMFLGAIGSMMQFISAENHSTSLDGLSSPLRQLYYVSCLNLTSQIDPKITLKSQFSDEEWTQIKNLLIEIELGYQQLFYPKNDAEITEEWINRRKVAMPSFLSYFNQGALNYEEQVIERIIDYFTPFNVEIKDHFGIEINEFIEIYNFIDSLPNKFLNEKINRKEGQQSWEEFAQEMTEKGLTPDKWNEYLPDHFKELFGFIYDQGKMYRFKVSQIEDKFGKDKTTSFLSALTCERTETDFLYYTETNILYSKPLFNVGANEFQTLETGQIIHAIYNLLFDYCTSDETRAEKFYAVRGSELENKIEKIFNKFFNNKCTIYKSYYTTDGHEQDLLVIYDNLALIIEAKASKRKEPRRDPDKAYPLIISNFEEVIQKGYDQAYRVKSKFIENKPFNLYSDQKITKLITTIYPKKIYNVFSVVVTLERFGQQQIDLSELLEIWDDDEYPWSICIDDLEVFLLALQKLKKTKLDFINFLHFREKLHGKVLSGDELEICGGYLTKEISYKSVSQKEILALSPSLATIFDEFYHKGGLGFDNEKNMDLKTDSKYHIIGH